MTSVCTGTVHYRPQRAVVGSESPEQCLGHCKLPSVLYFGLVLCRGGHTLGITRSLLVLGSVLEITRLPTPSQSTLDLSLGLGELPQRCVTWTPVCGGTESGRRQSVGGARARDAFAFPPVFEASPLVLAASLLANISLIPSCHHPWALGTQLPSAAYSHVPQNILSVP